MIELELLVLGLRLLLYLLQGILTHLDLTTSQVLQP